ncbi:hypothetical protein [Actinoplanes subglobosus]|uniref:Uncharacterized protein n=1 Tax=Actinoplanes subglobosus TaxID=1547892 RepID=A0ABV8IY94_9ACTN
MIHRFEPYADHLMFMISEPDGSDDMFDGDDYDSPDESWRLAAGRGLIAVQTARFDHVLVTLTIRETPPPDTPFDGFDHVVEADILLPHGRLVVYGDWRPEDAEPITVAPGRYRVRVAYAPTDQRPAKYDEDGPGDHLEYQLTLWPAPAESGVRVLKQGGSPWAY